MHRRRRSIRLWLTIIIGWVFLTVNFTDQSINSPTSWSWTFGDDVTSIQQHPAHTYTTAGVYAVTLTAANATGANTIIKTNYITATTPPAPVAEFSATPTSGEAPLTVNFTDQSINSSTSWSWTFGDGAETSIQQHSVHTYTTAGVYTVTLTAVNATGANTITKTNYITAIQPAPVAEFSATPTSGEAPLTVRGASPLVGVALNSATGAGGVVAVM